jgi:hypothetical protein
MRNAVEDYGNKLVWKSNFLKQKINQLVYATKRRENIQKNKLKKAMNGL